jgi:nucleoside-diphosphate-sugar epimerase
MRILVTGANGFAGRRLCATLTEAGHKVHAAVRILKKSQDIHHPDMDIVPVDEIGPSTDWSSALNGVDVVIHLAARVHVMRDSAEDPLAEYRRVNVDGTRRLALMAVEAGVRRIVYVSTIKVNGEKTVGTPFSEGDIPSPGDPYSVSKWEVEMVLSDLSIRSGIETVTIRPPLVYGPGVKGNLLRLMQYIDRGYLLPFGGIQNGRSLISLDNLVDALLLCATRTECAGQTLLVSDGDDISTPSLIKKIAGAMGKEPKLINFPCRAISVAAKIVPALRPVVDRLTSSLVIDSSKFRKIFHWIPPQTIDDGIRSMVSDYLKDREFNAG